MSPDTDSWLSTTGDRVMSVLKAIVVLLYVLATVLTSGCGEPTPAVMSFEAEQVRGIFSNDLLYTYTGSRDLKDVNLLVTVYYEDGTAPVTKKYWANWKPNETKKVNVSAFPGSVERSDVSGKATLNGNTVALSASFRPKD
jgi:hypothetical protein